ncbi:hypothetical protein Pla175_12190 [Pirellulimonas nuda]|uniref:DUF4261 domain-containing protein n=1 Tax=Pirellulimonas nuda TaxID=2528009 RepID=A0A518D8Q1_9BACT|nr:DUF4261 domain-containing protein [Pirellulimonas nuda]QDU87852.1 hypothetical protein Pla175_12190 [Pirellulimonas nuda]
MSSNAPWISLVALADQEVPSPDDVAQCMADAFPDASPLAVSGSTPRAATFDWGPATVNYTLVDRPIPWSQIEGPCATAWYWPEAEAVMRRHAAHLFVTLLSEKRDPIDRSMRLTQLVTAVSEAAGADGIVWGPSSLVHEPAAFRKLATTMSREDLPLHLWVDFRVSELDDGAFALFTTGMEALGSRELEVNRFVGEPHVLAGYAYNIAHYLLEKTPQLKEGEAIGLPDGAQASIRFEPSLVDESLEAIRLDFDG